MLRNASIAALLATAAVMAAPAQSQEASWSAADWDRARASLVAQGPGRMAPAIREWERLKATKTAPFEDYASFMLSFPGFPDAGTIQETAEARLSSQFVALAPNGRVGIVDFKLDGAGGPGPRLEERLDPDVIRRDAHEAGLRLLREETFLRYQYLLVFGR
jgi:hypothetical protein